MQRWMRQAALMALASTLTACATVFNPGGVRTMPDPPPGWSGRVMKLAVWRMPRSAEFFVNGARIDLSKVRRDRSWYNGTGGFEGFDMTVMIPQDAPVDIRIVDGTRSAEVHLQAEFHKVWIYYNLLLGPAIPIGFLVDSKTKKWTFLKNDLIDATALLERVAVDAGRSARRNP